MHRNFGEGIRLTYRVVTDKEHKLSQDIEADPDDGTRPKPLDPKSSASTNFATSAFASAKIQLIFQLEEEKDKKLGSCLLFRNFITIFAN